MTNIYWHLRKDSPLTNTRMITMATDRIGDIIDDAAYDNPAFEATSTPPQRGCAETAKLTVAGARQRNDPTWTP